MLCARELPHHLTSYSKTDISAGNQKDGMKTILLGAGASNGTLGDKAPLARDFGKYLSDSKYMDNYPYLSAVIESFKKWPSAIFGEEGISDDNWPLDKIWGAIDNRVKLQDIVGLELSGAPFPPPTNKKIYGISLDPWGLAGFELRCATTWVYGSRLKEEIEKAANRDCKVKKVFEDITAGDCIISFNYDCLAEKLLDSLRKDPHEKIWILSNPYLDLKNDKDRILLCKPHGSLTWKQRSPENGKAVEILEDPMVECDIDYCPSEKSTIQPGIIAPVPYKSELIIPELQQRKVPNFFSLLVSQWKNSMDRISKVDELIVMGYGFPPEDYHALYLFSNAVARRTSSLKSVTVYERNECTFECVKERIKGLFRIENDNIIYRGPVE